MQNKASPILKIREAFIVKRQCRYGGLLLSNSYIVKKPFRSKLKTIRENPFLFGLIVLVLVSLLLFSVYPMYSIFKTIFVGEKGLDFNAVQKAFHKPLLFQTIWNSFKLGISSAA